MKCLLLVLIWTAITYDEKTLIIVFPGKQDALGKAVFILEPVGTALIDCREGGIIVWEVSQEKKVTDNRDNPSAGMAWQLQSLNPEKGCLMNIQSRKQGQGIDHNHAKETVSKKT